MKINKLFLTLFIIEGVLFSSFCSAQKNNILDYIKIEITPNHSDWTYQTGENASFTIRVLKANCPINDISVNYTIGPEKMSPLQKGEISLKNGIATIEAGTMSSPGFLTCTCQTEVDGFTYTNYVNVAFSPEEIKPTTILPEDFHSFWEKALKENTKIPMEPLITLLPEQCTSTLNVYEVRLQHYKKDSYLYGLLCVPKKPGKYPAVLRVPGAGVKKNPAEIRLAEKGMITFAIGIHGIPLILDEEVYDNLRYGVLADYPSYKLDNKDEYYFRRVYTGCIRALDFLCDLPEYDGENLGVIGGSQGGALAMITASLDKRVKALVAFYPALCDLTGYLHGRAGGWPHLFNSQKKETTAKQDKVNTCYYYDVVNFARFIETPGFYSWGYNDPTCPPTSYYSAYNVVTAPKQLFVAHYSGHWRTQEQDIITEEWFCKILIK